MAINKRVISLVVILSIALILSLLSSNYFSDKNKVEEIIIDEAEAKVEYTFLVGERLKYNIYSLGIKVGEAIISYQGRKDLDGKILDYVTIESNAPGFKDLEKIYGNIKNFSPVRVEREIKLFGEDINIIEDYNEIENEVTITRRAKKTTVDKIKSADTISNVILLLYHFRNKNELYEIGDEIEFNLPTQKLKMLVDKKTQIKVPFGRFEAIFVRSKPSRFKVWFRDDEDRLPLRIQGAIGFGNTYLSLAEIE